jgi:hypothetical protein
MRRLTARMAARFKVGAPESCLEKHTDWKGNLGNEKEEKESDELRGYL